MKTNDLVEQYFDWLKSKTAWREVNGWTEITTPYLDRHNDYIQIYLQKNGNEWELSDDGETLTDLMQSGYELNTTRRKNLLQTILNGFGMQRVGNAITVKTTEAFFTVQMHNLIQAILAANCLFCLAQDLQD